MTDHHALPLKPAGWFGRIGAPAKTRGKAPVAIEPMNSISTKIEVTNKPARAALNVRRLAAIGIGLPALIVIANELALSHGNYRHAPAVLTGFVMAFYVLQIGTVGWVVGSFVHNSILRWFMFGWIMILIDLQLAVMTSDYGIGIGGSCLATAILTGQLGIIIIWGVLGTGHWIWRLPCLFAIGVTYWNFYQMLILVNQMTTYYGSFSDIALVQGVLLSALTFCLRMSGFSLTRLHTDLSPPTVKPRFRSSRQFGIRDALTWTTWLAVLLAIGRSGDLLNVEFLKRFYSAEMLFVFTVAVCSCVIMIAAIWAALGEGSVWLRSIVLLLLSTSIGVPIGVYCSIIGHNTGRSWWMNSIWILTEYWWIGWMILTGLFLATSLIIFRTQGFRLIQRASPAEAEASRPPS